MPLLLQWKKRLYKRCDLSRREQFSGLFSISMHLISSLMREMAAFGRSSLIREGGYCIMSICLYKLKKKENREIRNVYEKFTEFRNSTLFWKTS